MAVTYSRTHPVPCPPCAPKKLERAVQGVFRQLVGSVCQSNWRCRARAGGVSAKKALKTRPIKTNVVSLCNVLSSFSVVISISLVQAFKTLTDADLSFWVPECNVLAMVKVSNQIVVKEPRRSSGSRRSKSGLGSMINGC